MSDLPEKVNATFVLTYNVGEVRESLAELNGVDKSEIKDYEIMNLISDWVKEDFSGLAGQVTLQDEDGEEVVW